MNNYTVEFTVNADKIGTAQKQITADSVEVVRAAFDFDSTWNNLIKTAVFRLGETVYNVPLEEDECTIPFEVLKTGILYVSVFGVLNNTRATTNEAEIDIIKSGYTVVAPSNPTPDAYSSYVQTVTAIKDQALQQKVSAKGYAEAALEHCEAAEEYALAAQAQKTAAQTAKAGAESIKQDCEDIKDECEDYSAECSQSATNAQTYCTQCSQSAASAQTYCTECSQSAASAQTYCKESSQSAASAQTFKEAAATSAQSASAAATTASSAAESAEDYRDEIRSYMSQCENYSTLCRMYETSTNNNANTVAGYKDAAASSAETADYYANIAKGYAENMESGGVNIQQLTPANTLSDNDKFTIFQKQSDDSFTAKSATMSTLKNYVGAGTAATIAEDLTSGYTTEISRTFSAPLKHLYVEISVPKNENLSKDAPVLIKINGNNVAYHEKGFHKTESGKIVFNYKIEHGIASTNALATTNEGHQAPMELYPKGLTDTVSAINSFSITCPDESFEAAIPPYAFIIIKGIYA